MPFVWNSEFHDYVSNVPCENVRLQFFGKLDQ